MGRKLKPVKVRLDTIAGQSLGDRGAEVNPAPTEPEEIHALLVEKLKHNWRFETWKKKYAARLRIYGLGKCKIAIEGFVSQKWYVDNQSHNAPDLIFRSDKQLEKFLALGMKLQPSEDILRIKKENEDKDAKKAQFRAELELKNKVLTARFHRKIAVLEEELNEMSWKVWIKPLLFVCMEGKTVVLFHEYPEWVNEHYREKIETVIGAPVRITDNE